MATWGPVTVTGSGSWIMYGYGTTNHEAFAFQPQNAAPNTGALLTKVVVYNETSYYGATPTYQVWVEVVDINGNPSSNTISGYFNSNGV
jgi:hypothetical protein